METEGPHELKIDLSVPATAEAPIRRKPGRPKGSAPMGGRPKVVTSSGPAVKQIGIPLDGDDKISWSQIAPEKAARVEKIFGMDERIQARGQAAGDIGPEAAEFAFGVLSQTMVFLCRLRGMDEEAANLMTLRPEQKEPLIGPVNRELAKLIGPVSDRAIIGVGLAMSALQNFQMAQARQAEIDAGRQPAQVVAH